MISNNGKEETHIVIGIEIMLSDGVRAANEQLALVVKMISRINLWRYILTRQMISL